MRARNRLQQLQQQEQEEEREWHCALLSSGVAFVDAANEQTDKVTLK